MKKNHYQHKFKIQRKLNNLYNGSILFPNKDDKFLNLSNHELTQPQKDFLNLGSTCHLFNQFNHVQKQIEILYQNVLKHQEQNQVKTKPCSRRNFKLLFSAFIILTVDFIFSTDEDDLSHSDRMTFPGNVVSDEDARSFSSSHTFRTGQTDPLFLTYFSSRTDWSSLPYIFFELDRTILSFSPQQQTTIPLRRAHSIYGPLFSRKSFYYHLFLPPRPTDPQSFKLDV